MLFDITIGSGSEGIWDQTEDDYGNPLIENANISQSIRIAKNFDTTMKYIFPREDMDEEDDVYVLRGYEFAEGIKIVRNMNNMGMLMISNKRNDPNHFVYFTIDNEKYTMIDYASVNVDIINTYKKKDLYQGCLIQFDPSKVTGDLEEDDIPILKVVLWDGDVIKIVEVIYQKENDDIFVFVRDSKSVFDNFLEAHTERSFVHFRMTATQGFATNVILTTEKDAEEIKNRLEKVKIGSPQVIALSPENQKLVENGKFKESKELMKIFEENVSQKRTKAITVYNMRVDKSFLFEFKIRYLFKYDMEEDISYVLRSA